MLYQRAPRNIHRHVILSEIKEAVAALPPVRGEPPPGPRSLWPPALRGILTSWVRVIVGLLLPVCSILIWARRVS